jgi:RimJ/RimL family protein N-acetyltransferase
MRNLPILEGRLVRLDAFKPEHVKMYHRWMRDDYIIQMTETMRNLTLDDVARLRDEIETAEDKAHFLIFDRESSAPIGDADLRDIRLGDSAESTIMIAEPAFRRRGYAAEAYRLMLDYGFRQFSLERVIAPVLYFNTPSLSFHMKMGFQRSRMHGNDVILEMVRKQLDF